MVEELLQQILSFVDPKALKHPRQNLHHLNAMDESEPIINTMQFQLKLVISAKISLIIIKSLN